jgi:hypothetical protein
MVVHTIRVLAQRWSYSFSKNVLHLRLSRDYSIKFRINFCGSLELADE